jgi:phage shock protein PspC (stress-responsive transcriptional regulator)
MPKSTPPESPTAPAAEPAASSESSSKPSAAPRHGARFFAWIRSLGLVRQPGWIGGVSAGIADRIGIDVVIVRGIFVVVALIGGPAILLYAAAWLLLPDTNNRIHFEDLLRGKVDSPVIGIAILFALSLLPVAQGFWWFGSLYWGEPHFGDSVGRALWTIVILGLLVGFVVWMSRRAARDRAADGPSVADPPVTTAAAVLPETAEPPAPPAESASPDAIAHWRETQAAWKAQNEAFREQRAAERQATSQAAVTAARAERIARALEYREQRARTRSNPAYSTAVVGIALVAGAITTLALGKGTLEPINALTGIAVAVGVLGLGIILNGAMGRRSGGASAVAILLLIPLLAAVVFPQSSSLRYQGSSVHTLHYSSQGAERYYYQVSGNVTIDLANYFPTTKPSSHALPEYNSIEVWVGSGNVTVIVPKTTANEFEFLSARSLSGTITSPSGAKVPSDWRSVNAPEGTAIFRSLGVSVYAASGNVKFVEAPATNGASK